LAGSALPLPGCYESRDDKAARLAFERARAKRPALLARRVESIKAKGGRGRRGELVDKVQCASVLLLHGESIDKAAELAGFKASGSGRHAVKAGDRLAQAVRRLGFKFQFTARQRTDGEAARRVQSGAALPASIPAAWAFRPAADLPGQDGRGAKRWLAKIQRIERARARAARMASASAARADRLGKAQLKRGRVQRSAARAFKGSGLMPDCQPWILSYHEARAARVARPKL
jgi:hypothetical protein